MNYIRLPKEILYIIFHYSEFDVLNKLCLMNQETHYDLSHKSFWIKYYEENRIEAIDKNLDYDNPFKWIEEIHYIDYINKCIINIKNGAESHTKFLFGHMDYGMLHINLNDVNINNISILNREIKSTTNIKIVDNLVEYNLSQNVLRIGNDFFMVDKFFTIENKSEGIYSGEYYTNDLELLIYQLFRNIKK